MNQNHVQNCVQKNANRFLNRYLILAIALLSFGMVYAQNSAGKIIGTVLSAESNEPLIGVSVVVIGTSQGTITDIDGKFTVQADKGQKLKVSYIGYETQEVVVSGPVLKIVLKEESKSLDELIVVGYGVQKKKLNTGATVQVKGD